MKTSRTNHMDLEKMSLGRSLLICFIIAVVYAILSVKRMKNGYKTPDESGVRNHILHDEPQQETQSPLGATIVAQSKVGDQPFLIDTAIIQVVLVIMAVAFTIRAFTVSDFQALSLLGNYFFFDRINITQVANVVFIASGTITILLYGVYVWEWMDKYFGVSAPSRYRVTLVVLGLIAHASFLLLLALILILQILMSNVIPE